MIRRPPRSTLFPTRRSSDLNTTGQGFSLSIYPARLAQWSAADRGSHRSTRSEEHTSELQSQSNLVCRLLLEKKKKGSPTYETTPDGGDQVAGGPNQHEGRAR